METCRKFKKCNANLCPRDPDIHLRTWFVGEKVCLFSQYQDLPLVQRQRQLNRRKPASMMEKRLTYDYLVKTAPRKRILSESHKAQLLEAARRHRFGQKATPGNHEIESLLEGRRDNGGEPAWPEIAVVPAELVEETKVDPGIE
jgi:hypothetical protein